MATHAAFLRGINLGKNRRVKGDALCAAFSKAGFADVAAFRASGNVVFTAEGGEADELAARSEAALADSLGFEVVVFLRTGRELRAIAAHEPFKADVVERSKGKLQVAILPQKPTAAAKRAALALGTDEDFLSVRGRELYWLPSGGISDSELDLKTLEAELGPWTMRTMGTIEQIASKHFS